LLRVVQHADTARIELIHDRMVEVVCKVRNERRAKERQAEQVARVAHKVRRRLWIIAAVNVATLPGDFARP
jgi:hypothetical protein